MHCLLKHYFLKHYKRQQYATDGHIAALAAFVKLMFLTTVHQTSTHA